MIPLDLKGAGFWNVRFWHEADCALPLMFAMSEEQTLNFSYYKHEAKITSLIVILLYLPPHDYKLKRILPLS